MERSTDKLKYELLNIIHDYEWNHSRGEFLSTLSDLLDEEDIEILQGFKWGMNNVRD